MSTNYMSVNKINSLKSNIESITNKNYDNLTQGIQYFKNAYKNYAETISGTALHAVIPPMCTAIKPYCFYENLKLKNITIPSNVVSIGDHAFYFCTSLTNVSIPDSVTTIGEYAFYGCLGLYEVETGNGVTSIDSNAFSGCIELTRVILSNNLKSIKFRAFYNCRKLTEITIPASVTYIADEVFDECGNFANIYLKPTTPPTLNLSDGIPTHTTIHVPVGSGEAYKNATNWSSHADRIVEDIEL